MVKYINRASIKKFDVMCTDGEIRKVGDEDKLIIIPKEHMEQFPILRDAYRAWVKDFDRHSLIKTTMPKQHGYPHGWHFMKNHWVGESVIYQDNIEGFRYDEAEYLDNKAIMLNSGESQCLIASINKETFYPSQEIIEQLQAEAIDICRSKLIVEPNSRYYNTQLERHERYHQNQEFEKSLREQREAERDEKTDIVLSTLEEKPEEEKPKKTKRATKKE